MFCDLEYDVIQTIEHSMLFSSIIKCTFVLTRTYERFDFLISNKARKTFFVNLSNHAVGKPQVLRKFSMSVVISDLKK